MRNDMTAGFDRYGNFSRSWWLAMLTGIVLFIIGLLVFGYPGQSYIAMSLVFGIVILVSGIVQLVMAASERNLPARGWVITGGIIEAIIGLILTFYPAVSAATLPYFLGFWLIFRGINLLSLTTGMRANNIPGMGWTIFLAVLLFVCAVFILLNPIVYGIGAVVIWVGVSFIVAGVSLFIFSFQLRNIRNRVSRREY